MYADTSAEIGFGAFIEGRGTNGRWPLAIRCMKLSIAFLDFFPNMLAPSLWGSVLHHKRVVFWSDNQAVVAIINRQTSRCPQIMKLVSNRMLVISVVWSGIPISRHVMSQAWITVLLSPAFR